MSKPDFVAGVYVDESPQDFVIIKQRLNVTRFKEFLDNPYVKEFVKKNNDYLNMDVLKSKGGKYYLPFSEFKPEKKVTTTDTFWVYPYTSSDRVGLSAKKPFIIESMIMNRSYIDPDTNNHVFLKDIPNQHSSNSGVREYNPLDELVFAEMYGNYFIKPSVNQANQNDAGLNVVDSAFGSPLDASNLVSTRNIEEVMLLGDYKAKIRRMNRLPHLSESYLYLNTKLQLVQ